MTVRCRHLLVPVPRYMCYRDSWTLLLGPLLPLKVVTVLFPVSGPSTVVGKYTRNFIKLLCDEERYKRLDVVYGLCVSS